MTLHVKEEDLIMERVSFADEIHDARESGLTWRQIAEETNMSVGRLRRIARMLG